MKDDNLIWCLKQKHGIRIIEPNPNLTKAYLKKAASALNTMTAALQINEVDWIATTAYYARYFALYALLMKIGAKSEIHDCTINLAQLLANQGIIRQALVNDIAQAKQERIDAQYYIATALNHNKIKKNVDAARNFVLELEEIIENITLDQVNSIRNYLREKQKTAKK
ncbi:MAG: HEPN domain-containing protein [Candidatus Bathyarchaeota archaeon]|nr:HEPN domain-containing protein [Candidatus Bathyarchaeota archaeon]